MKQNFRIRILTQAIILLVILLTFPWSCWGFGFIQGYVKNNADQAIEGAHIATDGALATSLTDGSYMLALPPGTYTLTASAPGYENARIENQIVTEGQSTTLDFTLNPLGLTIEAVYPTLGQMGHDLDVTLSGSGFDDNTRVSMSLDVGNIMKIIGSVDTMEVWALELVGSIAYIVSANGFFSAIDISAPEDPVIIESIPLGGGWDIAVSNLTAYVITTSSLELINIDTASPEYLTVIRSIGGFSSGSKRVVIDSSRAFVTDYNNDALVIVDIDPASPTYGTLLATAPVNNPTYLEVSGGIAYVAEEYNQATYFGGIELVDVNPSSLTYLEVIGSYDQQQCQGIAIRDNLAYIANRNVGLLILDIDPASSTYLTLLGYALSFDMAQNLELVGDIAYVTDAYNGLLSIDVSDPTNPEVIGWVDTPGWATDVKIANGKAFIAAYDGGLQVIDISQPEGSAVLGSVIGALEHATSMALQENYAYVGSSGNFHVVDISNPGAPFIARSLSIPGTPYGLDVSGNRAYVPVGNSDMLEIIDISDPYNPVIVGSIDAVEYAFDVKVIGTLAYVADSSAGLHIIDVDPQSPDYLTVEETIETPTGIYYLAAHENRVYLGDWTNIYIFDIDPMSSNYRTIIGTYAMGSTNEAVGVYEDVILVGNGGTLKTVDVSNPAIPLELSSIEVGSTAKGFVVDGNRAYAALSEGTLLILDISDPSDPLIVGSVAVPGRPYGMAVKNDAAYVAAYRAGLQIVPLPVEIDPVQVASEAEIAATLPSPSVAGHYLLRVFNNSQSDQLAGAVTFTDNLQVLNAKAIIVAGGGPDAPGEIWEETKLCANKAYDVLIQQGYDHDSVYYLSMETGNQFVDKPSLDFFLYDAIGNWAMDATELLLFFVDHGEPDSFILYTDGTYRQFVSADELDSMLDTLQETMNGPVTFVYDACQSGTFVSNLRPPEGKTRITITSASHEPAYFLNNGVESFSFQFWDKLLFNEGKIGYAFPAAAEIMGGYQTALIDADGNGVANESEDLSLAGNVVIRRGSPVLLDLQPMVGSVAVMDQTLNGSTVTTIFAENVSDADTVIAQIIPPDINPDTDGIPITALPSVQLVDPDMDGVYEAEYSDFAKQGSYIIIVKAVATEEIYSYVTGSMISQNIYSSPEYAYVTQTSGIADIDADEYEPDDTYGSANVIVVNNADAQSHNFHLSANEDWVKFYGIAAENIKYRIRTSNAGIACDAIIELFAGDGTTRIVGPQNDTGKGQDEVIEWTCPQDGFYYVKVSNDNDFFGENVKYDLDVYLPIAGIPGELVGIVKDSQGNGIGGAVLTSDVSSAATISYPNGYYIFVLPSGNHAITIAADGYEYHTEPNVQILAENRTTKDLVLYQPNELIAGDVNHDTDVGLIDAILALQVIAGTKPFDAHLGADVNADGRIGLEETIYILQEEAGLR